MKLKNLLIMSLILFSYCLSILTLQHCNYISHKIDSPSAMNSRQLVCSAYLSWAKETA